MSLPGSLTTATLTGTYIDQTGGTESGTVTIPMPGRMVYDPPGTPADRRVIVGAPLTVSLTAGAFSQTLIRGDNAGLPGFAYTVTENIVGEPAKQVSFTLTGNLDVSQVDVD